jgi:hypothetical protein
VRAGDLPPQEVLRNAVNASSELQSAVFRATFDATNVPMGTLSTTFHASVDGAMRDGGHQLMFGTDVTANATVDGHDLDMRMDADVIVATQKEVYVKFRAVQGLLAQALFLSPNPEQSMHIDQWQTWPTSESGSNSATVSDDPTLLSMQANIVDVALDRGLVNIHGRTAYMYDVVLNRERTLQYLAEIARRSGKPDDAAKSVAFLDGYELTGTLWIDAESFNMHQIRWHGVKRDDPSSTFDVSVELMNHGDPVTIAPPPNALPLGQSGMTVPSVLR